MRFHPRVTSFFIACFAAGAAFAAPASQPATLPSVTVDASTPKSALKSLTLALYYGDTTATRSLLLASTPTEDRMSHVMADMAEAVAKLNRAAAEQFGEAAATANQFGSSSAQLNEELAMLAAAKEIVDGDTATVSAGAVVPDASSNTVHLKRVEGRWKVSMTDLTGGAAPGEVDNQLAALAGQARLLQDAATDISSGKYKTAADAALALRGRVDTSASGHRAPGPHRERDREEK